MATPDKYTDPYWSDLSRRMEKKVGIPENLLTNVVLKGERSNNNQVSEAGARTVFQIIPQTRKAILNKYGIDPYLNPETAAEGAALLLKESLDRNKGNIKLAVAEYHGGTNKKNWGPRTKSYVQRVTGEDIEPTRGPPEKTDLRKSPSESTFQRALAKQEASKSYKQTIADVTAAYKNGQMTPEDAQQFEKDVNEGLIMLPRGESIKDSAQGSRANGAVELPEGVIRAFQSGQMTPEDVAELEKDVADGLVKAPPGMVLKQPKKDLGFFGGIKEAITGAERATEATRTLPEWTGMPELNELSMASAKTGLGTMFAAPDEIVEVIKANFPQTRVRQDEKGNYVISSSIDGADYVIPPGLTIGDIPRVIGGLAAFTPAGRATSIAGSAAAAAGTQGAIEASQSATGGTFNPKDVALAGAVGGLTPPVIQGVKAIGGAIANPVKAAISKVTGVTPESIPVPAATSQEAVSPVVNAPVHTVPEASVKDIAQTAVKAGDGGLGSKKAVEQMVEMAAPDQKTIEAAKRLDVLENLQADHVSTNRTFRDIAQAAKAEVGSVARTEELKGLEEIANRADTLIKKLGGSEDLSTVSLNIKKGLQKSHDETKAAAKEIYDEIDAKLVKTASPAPAPNALQLVKERARELGGEKHLSQGEKDILTNLSPTNGVEPTYGLLDKTRKEISAARRGAETTFGNTDSKVLQDLESALRLDQGNVAAANGFGNRWENAQTLSRIYKGMQNDLVDLFGETLDKSIVGDLSGAISALPKGDTGKFIQLIKSVPEDMRQELVASGLGTAFGKHAKQHSISFNSYANWYKGLVKNKQAYNALMSNLPKEARKSLSDLYRVSNGIANASKERIPTGRLLTAKDAFKGGETLAAKIYENAKHHYVAVGAGTAANLLFPSLGVVVASVLSKGAKQPGIKAADKLFSSPDFQKAVLTAANGKPKDAAKKLARSSVFSNYIKKAKLTDMKNMSDRERWILQALEAGAPNVSAAGKQKEK